MCARKLHGKSHSFLFNNENVVVWIGLSLQVVYAGGEMDAVCYACTCSVDSMQAARSTLASDYCTPFEDDKSSAGAN